MKIGIAWFTQSQRPSSGWCYRDGHVLQFGSIGDLDHSVIWLTNIGHSVFNNSQLWQFPFLREDQYLRLGLTQISRELGLDMTLFESIKKLGEIVCPTALSMSKLFEVDLFEQKYRLFQGMVPSLVPQQYIAPISEDSPEYTQRAITNSFQSLQGATKGVRTNAKVVTFTLPRVALANWLLSQRYPLSSKYKEIKISDSSIIAGHLNGSDLEGTKVIVEQLKVLHRRYAVFMKVNILSMSKDYVQGFTFGFEGATTNMRQWVSLPELIELLSYCKVEILDGVATSCGLLECRPDIDFEQNNISYSRGIIADNIVATFAEKASDGTAGRRVTALGAYLRAYDRIVCGRLAQEFMRKGFPLAGFGGGGVRIWANVAGMEVAKKIALQWGATSDFAQMNQ
ncbi:TPA: hypothetical protein I7117_14935 [Vibrio vulnificus]|uniref:hypothetical protein n=1 Tax=Vibrio navarrensis TaxID=29495 RepID=UPI0018DE4BBA|nr:hypothetical protein [Vibrio navarrensis]MBH9739961.1 hypothetical protein [Vibrio navarrensis]HAS6100758.1 hypothetical protein [Vibrio vulnificus]